MVVTFGDKRGTEGDAGRPSFVASVRRTEATRKVASVSARLHSRWRASRSNRTDSAPPLFRLGDLVAQHRKHALSVALSQLAVASRREMQSVRTAQATGRRYDMGV